MGLPRGMRRGHGGGGKRRGGGGIIPSSDAVITIGPTVGGPVGGLTVERGGTVIASPPTIAAAILAAKAASTGGEAVIKVRGEPIVGYKGGKMSFQPLAGAGLGDPTRLVNTPGDRFLAIGGYDDNPAWYDNVYGLPRGYTSAVPLAGARSYGADKLAPAVLMRRSELPLSAQLAIDKVSANIHRTLRSDPEAGSFTSGGGAMTTMTRAGAPTMMGTGSLGDTLTVNLPDGGAAVVQQLAAQARGLLNDPRAAPFVQQVMSRVRELLAQRGSLVTGQR